MKAPSFGAEIRPEGEGKSTGYAIWSRIRWCPGYGSISRSPYQLRSWPNWGAQPQAMFIKDEDGQLMPMLHAWAAEIRPLPPPQITYDEVLGQLTGVAALVCRGEGLRAWEGLTWVRGGLMRLVRWASSAPQPPAVARWAEEELPIEWSQALGRLAALPPVQACLMALVLAEELAARMQLDARPQLLAAVRAQVRA